MTPECTTQFIFVELPARDFYQARVSLRPMQVINGSSQALAISENLRRGDSLIDSHRRTTLRLVT
jgi:hypothetical protein